MKGLPRVLMKKKIYIIQPTYRDQDGILLKGDRLYVVSLALPAVSSLIPPDWDKEFCYEYFENINFDTDASVVGLSSMGYEIFRGVEIAEEFKKRGKTVLFGGFQPHISRPFVDGSCDAVIHGNPGRADMQRILMNVTSGSLQRDYFCQPDIDYPMDYSVLDPTKLLFTPVLFSIGCRNACDYCCIASVYGGVYRLRKLDHVFQELHYLHPLTRRIAVVDVNVYNNREFLKRVCDEMIRRRYRFVWGAQSTVDIGHDPEILALMKRAGCRILYIGLETITQSNLDAVHKVNTVESYRQCLAAIARAGIRVAAFFIYGLDGDTPDTAARLSTFVDETDIALPMMNILVPTPGSKVYENLKAEGRLRMKDEQEFLRNNIAYNSSFNICLYEPKRMTAREVEDGFIDLLGRLSGLWQILRRSLSTDITLSLFLLRMNWTFREEFVRLRKLRAGQCS